MLQPPYNDCYEPQSKKQRGSSNTTDWSTAANSIISCLVGATVAASPRSVEWLKEDSFTPSIWAGVRAGRPQLRSGQNL